MRRTAGVSLLLGLSLVSGCSDPASSDDPDSAVPLVPLVHQFPTVDVASGEELFDLCQSWTLDNHETLYVNSVELTAGPGWHHSNWLFAPDESFDGPDGIWPCSDRNFDELAAGLQGGVVTAQSTQATHDIQTFLPGHALVIPAGSRIIGTSHALNASGGAIQTSIGLTLTLLEQDEVTTRLHAMSFQNRSLALQPSARSRFSTSCSLADLHQDGIGRPLDFSIHYVLPHYHSLGEGLTLAVSGGADDGAVIFGGDALTGEAAGAAVDPPYDLTGADGLTMTCRFENPTDEVVGWGFGDQEMCVMLAFTDSEMVWAGGVQRYDLNEVLGPAEDGVFDNQAPCTTFYYPPRD